MDMDSGESVIEAAGVRRSYGGGGGSGDGFEAVRGVSFEVARGELFALLGTNGAGKTSTVELLEGLARPSGGMVRVLGQDPYAERARVRPRIGVMLQEGGFPAELTVGETARMWAGCVSGARPVDEALAMVGLAARRGVRTKQLSGGERRRLDLGLALLGRPEVLFLDEPTTGLDPRGRAEVWAAVRSLVGGGTTVLLTTQYLEEADRLADRISVIDAGRVAAEGTADELKALVGGDRIDVVIRDAAQLGAAAGLLTDGVVADADRRLIGAPAGDRMATLTRTVRALEEAGIEAEDIAVRRPTLDEVFLSLTDRKADDAEVVA
jgi:ABC-2 type transport system ATP-binding protein